MAPGWNSTISLSCQNNHGVAFVWRGGSGVSLPWHYLEAGQIFINIYFLFSIAPLYFYEFFLPCFRLLANKVLLTAAFLFEQASGGLGQTRALPQSLVVTDQKEARTTIECLIVAHPGPVCWSSNFNQESGRRDDKQLEGWSIKSFCGLKF